MGPLSLGKTVGTAAPQSLTLRQFGPLELGRRSRKRALSWLAERVNTFVNVMRPRVRSAAPTTSHKLSRTD